MSSCLSCPIRRARLLHLSILYERLAGQNSSDPQTRHDPPMSVQAPPGAPVPPPFSRSHSANHQYQDMNDESSNNDYIIPYDRAPLSSRYGISSHPSVVHTSPPLRRTSGDPAHESRRGGFNMSRKSRKRGRNEMDTEDDAVDYSTGVPDDRGKRYREHHRSIDSPDDGRMGPP